MARNYLYIKNRDLLLENRLGSIFSLKEWVILRGVIKNKNFLKLWLGQTISIFGDQLHFIALMVLIQNFYGDLMVTGTVMVITALPKVLFSPFAGVLVDRWSLKWTMVVSDLIRMLLVLTIPFIFTFVENPNMSVIFVITFLISTVSVFFYPAKSASIPTLVEKEELLAANSLSGVTQMIIGLLGLFGGAILVSLIGTTSAFIIDAASFLISAIFVFLIKYPHKESLVNSAKLNGKVYLHELKLGAKYLLNNRLLRFMLGFFVSLMLIGGATNISFFAFIEDVLKKDASVIGYIYGLNMIGMLLGMALVSKITKRYPKEKLLVWSTFIFSMALLSVSFVESLYILIPIMIINGVGNGILNVVSNTIFQENIDQSMRGRVFSVIDASVNSASILSMLPAAWLAETFGVKNVFLGAGIIIFILFLVSLKKINILFKSTDNKQTLVSQKV